MNAMSFILLNFEEVRRRSIELWMSIPQDKLDWRPDPEAMSCREMIHHVLEGEYLYHQMLEKPLNLSLTEEHNPYKGITFSSVEEALKFAQPYREKFIEFLGLFNEKQLTEIKIDRSEMGYIRELGDMLLRVAYHESVHTGQLLDYLRTAKVKRPIIWD